MSIGLFVFLVCPVGTWGPSCSNICNCGMNVRQCDQVTGCTVCQSGWKGPLCTEDVNECAEGSVTCPADADCLNVPGTYYCICHDPTQTNPDNTCGNSCHWFYVCFNCIFTYTHNILYIYVIYIYITLTLNSDVLKIYRYVGSLSSVARNIVRKQFLGFHWTCTNLFHNLFICFNFICIHIHIILYIYT